MAAMRANTRLQVGSVPWISEERSAALQIAESEAEEFTFSARNEIEWLNEHMGEIFSENNVNVADIFKTPGKLRGKTPRTARKINPLESRPPLSDVFSATPRGVPSPFKQTLFQRPVATFQVAEDEPSQPEPVTQEAPLVESLIQRKPAPNHYDSGYFGSQATQATQPNELSDTQPFEKILSPKADIAIPNPIENTKPVEDRESEGSFQSAKEEFAQNQADEMQLDTDNSKLTNALNASRQPILESPLQSRIPQASSPHKRSPQRSPERPKSAFQSPPKEATQIEDPSAAVEDEQLDDVHSPSDGSSPIRPIVVRKSSLNFASLPAREPLTTKKSLGNRTSRTSQLEQSRTSYYGRTTGGKSLGNVRHEDEDDMDLDTDDNMIAPESSDAKMARLHNKTSTQRLQDQISKLGQSQSQARPASKSIAGSGLIPAPTSQLTQPATSQDSTARAKSPQRVERPPPGAFPEDEEESWIGPQTATQGEASIFSPRLQLSKSHSADVMEGIRGKNSIGGSQFNIPKRGEDQHHRSPIREPIIPERTTSTLGHMKSVSTSVLRSPRKAGDSPGDKKPISVSNPNPSLDMDETRPVTPKSPSRSFRGSPLKAAKDKFSSILKTSKGLFASSAAVSADAKTSTLSPHYESQLGTSFEDVLSNSNDKGPLYPSLDQGPSRHIPSSPPKPSARKTRASTEREERRKEEEAMEAREAKETQKMADQLGKARMKVKEEARQYHLEQERAATMQKEAMARKEQEKQAKAHQPNVPKATRSSPRKAKTPQEAKSLANASTEDVSNRDVEISGVSTMPPPAVPRPKSQIGRPGPKRPIKPAKEPLVKNRPPTVIRVDTGSQRGHQYHPSNSTLAASLQDSLLPPTGAAPPASLRKKASTSSIQSKASTSSFKSAASKALEAAARKKEQDELAAQRKREAKQEVERQRAALKEEERRKEEQQRKQEAERQREIQRERERVASAADAKKAAARQAAEKRRQEIERAKQTGAPPPAARHLQDKALPPVPAQRTEINQSKPRVESTMHRAQEDLGRPVNTALHNAAKVPPKRPLQQDIADENLRPGNQRNGPSYQSETHGKRRRTSEGFDDDDLTENQPKMTAPPIRQSSSRPKDVQPKSLFPSGYTHAPSSANLQRSTLISQHNINQSKPAHPMDMAQLSKAPIPFASSSSQNKPHPYKTPARPVGAKSQLKSTAKSAAKSSPQYQNGENIDLPDIHTDSDDSEDDADNGFTAPDWTNSPAIREQLTRQEPMDPSQIFGNPGPLNMEEVFNKSKDKFSRFRDRTSSANWGGIDRLTEDEIRKDLEARDRLRRQGGWTYDSMI